VSAPAGPLRVEPHLDGALWRVLLARPKANLLDSAMTRALIAVFREAAETPALKAVTIEGEGAHFSFGASVEEHLPGQLDAMLTTFHGLFDAILAARVPMLAVVRGQCLGGGLELAAFAHRLFAAPDARLGQPELRLGVFAPVASVLLGERMSRGAAEELLLTGRTLTADEALRSGLVDEVAPDPWAAALGWCERHLQPLSAASLRVAVQAARLGFARRFAQELAAVERLYRDDLQQLADAGEGIRAFLERRPPQWRHA
jgi:cyclohexa-1,5-dienecarbonyl-CoA hydratase